MSDIIKRLTENAHVLEAHRYTAAAATMREAAEIIYQMREAGGMIEVRQVAGGWDVT